jgi:hypothetical protein
MKATIHIFDLDGTVIDSSHRQRLKPNGDLDLDHWIAHRFDREKVFGDTLLPFVSHWREVQQHGEETHICTSRVISDHEREFLLGHGLNYGEFMSRTDGDFRSDAPYKVAKIGDFLKRRGVSPLQVILYDDHHGVRQAVKAELGCWVIDPVRMTRMIDAVKAA